MIITTAFLYTAVLYSSGGSIASFKAPRGNMNSIRRNLSVSSWNVAAINNNPFEYWITIKDNPDYEKLMIDIENFLENPGPQDIPVHKVFNDHMYYNLRKQFQVLGWFPGQMDKYWETFKKRKIVSEFLKDPELGSKRLASMPDRITNTINVEGSDEPVCRPTVINMYEGDLSTMNKWHDEWMKFMFETPLPIKSKGVVESRIPYTMLKKISRAKYPAVTPEEEEMSLPLQTLCGAVFDAILVHMMNTVSSPNVWQPLKHTMVENLNRKKVPHTIEILKNTYGATDVITLQEVSASFIGVASRELGSIFHVVAPAEIDAVRDQNSVILLKKSRFPKGAKREYTDVVLKSFPPGQEIPAALGDILAIDVEDAVGNKFLITSFHGDTNGLATIPVLTALMKAKSSVPEIKDHKLIFGLDANTYQNGKPGKKQDVMEFGDSYNSFELTSCWGDKPDPGNYTTYNARTYLQPQLNKACKSSQKREFGDINPKDFILFDKNVFVVESTWKDNTGRKEYIEDMAFPTLEFPSDHGILSTVLKFRE